VYDIAKLSLCSPQWRSRAEESLLDKSGVVLHKYLSSVLSAGRGPLWSRLGLLANWAAGSRRDMQAVQDATENGVWSVQDWREMCADSADEGPEPGIMESATTNVLPNEMAGELSRINLLVADFECSEGEVLLIQLAAKRAKWTNCSFKDISTEMQHSGETVGASYVQTYEASALLPSKLASPDMGQLTLKAEHNYWADGDACCCGESTKVKCTWRASEGGAAGKVAFCFDMDCCSESDPAQGTTAPGKVDGALLDQISTALFEVVIGRPLMIRFLWRLLCAPTMLIERHNLPLFTDLGTWSPEGIRYRRRVHVYHKFRNVLGVLLTSLSVRETGVNQSCLDSKDCLNKLQAPFERPPRKTRTKKGMKMGMKMRINIGMKMKKKAT